MIDNPLRRTWAEVDLEALAGNYAALRKHTRPEAKIMAVVKTDGYGHGVEPVVRTLDACGADWFAVACLAEAIDVRRVTKKPILIFGYTPPGGVDRLIWGRFTQAVFSRSYAQTLSQAASAAGVTIPVHINVDTGMSRLGFFYQNLQRDEAAIDEIEEAVRLPGLSPQGIYTHFAAADEPEGKAFTNRQFAAFLKALELLEQRGIRFELRHCCNSAGAFSDPAMHLDMIRPGIALYGIAPSADLQGKLPIRPVMHLKTMISQMKEIPPGATVSYGRTFTAKKTMRLAIVQIGYGDGYFRSFSSIAQMMVDGKRAPVVGRVCMDQLMLDITGIDAAREGMEVSVFGGAERGGVSAAELAVLGQTIPYEIVCAVGKRVPRVYPESGTETAGLG